MYKEEQRNKAKATLVYILNSNWFFGILFMFMLVIIFTIKMNRRVSQKNYKQVKFVNKNMLTEKINRKNRLPLFI